MRLLGETTMPRFACVALAVIALALTAPTLADANQQRVLLKDVTAITLSRTAQTTGRRSSPVPQLSCVGGPCQWAPSTVLCSNAGFDGADVLWKCKAELEKGIKLGDVTVSCEGFDYPDDPYILRGSCGLEYTLTGVAEVDKNQRYSTGHHGSYQQPPPQRHYYEHSPSGSEGGSWFMWGVVLVIAYVLYKSCVSGGRGSGDLGGGGGGGFSGGPGGPSGGSWGSSSSSSCPPGSSSSSSGPGFWTGMAGGSVLGYLAGSRNSRAGASYTRTYSSGQPSASFSSGWASSGGSSSSSSPSPSMGTSSSSAFGGTRRR